MTHARIEHESMRVDEGRGDEGRGDQARGDQGVSRRAALKTLGASVGAFALWPALSPEAVAALARVQRTQGPAELKFLTAAQYATIEALSEAIIPADDRSPGAKEARVADYIDLLLAESRDETQTSWSEGLAALERTCQERYQAPFEKLSASEVDELLTEISQNESAPETTLEELFKAAKDAAIRGYYTSEIGIHQELEYKGNQYLTEFVGCTHPEHGFKG